MKIKLLMFPLLVQIQNCLKIRQKHQLKGLNA